MDRAVFALIASLTLALAATSPAIAGRAFTSFVVTPNQNMNVIGSDTAHMNLQKPATGRICNESDSAEQFQTGPGQLHQLPPRSCTVCNHMTLLSVYADPTSNQAWWGSVSYSFDPEDPGHGLALACSDGKPLGLNSH
jgi:hypothetical protein